MTAVDVGACFGYRSLLLSELVGETGRAFSFEPNPRSFHLLKRNIDINGFKPRCAVYPLAIGAIDGIGNLTIHGSVPPPRRWQTRLNHRSAPKNPRP